MNIYIISCTVVRVTPGGPTVFESQWNEGKSNSCLSCKFSLLWFEFNSAMEKAVLSMWCCCNVRPELVHKQNLLPFENMKHADYDRTDTTGWSTTEPRGERSMMTYYYFIFSEWSLIYMSRSLFGQVPPVIGVQSPWLCAPTCVDILQQGSLLSQYLSNDRSLHVMESVFRNPWNFCLWNPESWAMETGIHLKESGILLRIGIQNPSSTDKDWNQEPEIRNPEPKTVFACPYMGLDREAGSRFS